MPSGLPLCFLLPGKIFSWQNPFQLVLGILPLQGFDGFGTGFPVTAGNEKFCGNPLLGKHPLMFSGKALGKAAVVEIMGYIGQFKPTLGKVDEGMGKQLAVIGFKPDLSPILQKAQIFNQLFGMGQPLFVVVGLGPGVAEVDIDTGDPILGGDGLMDQLNLLSTQLYVGHWLSCKGGLQVAAGQGQHLAFNVHGDVVDLGILNRHLADKAPFAAAQFQVEGSLGIGKLFPPVAFILFRLGNIVRAGGQLRPGPGFSAHTHGEDTPFGDF